MAKKILRGKVKTTATDKDTRILWIFVFILALFIGASVFYTMNQTTKQDTYYVLNTNLPSRTQVTPADLSPVTTSKGSAPQNAIGINEVSQGTIYSKYPLQAGDVISASNSGPLDSINEGVPDNWVVLSFDPGSDDPVIQNLQRGDYFDIMATNMKKEDQRANPSDSDISDVKVGQYVFRNVMVLDNPMVTTDNENSDSANGATAQTQNSTTSFIVGMSPSNAAVLTMLMKNYDTKIVMSPRYNVYASPSELDPLYKTFNFNAVIGDNPTGIIASECLATNDDGSYKINPKTGIVDTTKANCTDPTFAPKERDPFGVPYEFNTKYDRRNEDGDIIPLTQNEIRWCKNLFDNTNDGYSDPSWDDEKQYCVDHTPSKPKEGEDFKKLYEQQKKDIADSQRESSSGSLSSSPDNSNDGSTSSDNGDGTANVDGTGSTESPAPVE